MVEFLRWRIWRRWRRSLFWIFRDLEFYLAIGCVGYWSYLIGVEVCLTFDIPRTGDEVMNALRGADIHIHYAMHEKSRTLCTIYTVKCRGYYLQ
jgi:hypothetical protein